MIKSVVQPVVKSVVQPVIKCGNGGASPIPLPVGATAHWDFSDASSLSFSSGTAISGATDLTGNGHNAAQATVDKQPAHTSSAINGLHAARFVFDYMSVPHDTALDGVNMMVFAVVKISTESKTLAALVVKWEIGVDLGWQLSARFFDNSQALVTEATGGALRTAGVAYTNLVDGQPRITGYAHNTAGSLLEFWLNGTAAASVAATEPSINTQPMLIGAYHPTGGFDDALIGEIIMYPYDASKIAGVHAYLAAKWGITL